MPVADTEIIDWRDDFLSDDTNTPYDSVDVQQLMDDEERNFKSVVRAEAENRSWVRFGHTVAYASATTFTTPGDQRSIYVAGRRLRAKLTGPVYVHGYVKSSSYGAGVTTVTAVWDGKVFTSSAFTVTSDNQITSSNSTVVALAAVNSIVEFGVAAAAPTRRLRKVSSVVPGSPSTINFATGDPWISDLVALAPTRLLLQSAGIDATLYEVELGILTSVNLLSGAAGHLYGGIFDIVLDGVTTSFDVPTPRKADVSDSIVLPGPLYTYKVAIQPLGVVSGTPSGAQWTRARNQYGANLPDSFRVDLPAAESGGTVRYAYVIVRDQ